MTHVQGWNFLHSRRGFWSTLACALYFHSWTRPFPVISDGEWMSYRSCRRCGWWETLSLRGPR